MKKTPGFRFDRDELWFRIISRWSIADMREWKILFLLHDRNVAASTKICMECTLLDIRHHVQFRITPFMAAVASFELYDEWNAKIKGMSMKKWMAQKNWENISINTGYVPINKKFRTFGSSVTTSQECLNKILDRYLIRKWGYLYIILITVRKSANYKTERHTKKP